MAKVRPILEMDALSAAKYKAVNNVAKVVRTGANSEIFINKSGRLTIRKVGRSGGLNSTASALRQCKIDSKGDRTKSSSCIKSVLGTAKATKATKAIK